MELGRFEQNRHDLRITNGTDLGTVRLSYAHFRSLCGKRSRGFDRCGLTGVGRADGGSSSLPLVVAISSGRGATTPATSFPVESAVFTPMAAGCRRPRQGGASTGSRAPQVLPCPFISRQPGAAKSAGGYPHANQTVTFPFSAWIQGLDVGISRSFRYCPIWVSFQGG